MSKKNKAGSVKQKPLVECKAVQLGKWVLGHELNQNFFALIRTHIENTVGSHRQDSVTKTRLRFFERGLASGDKPSILSFGLEQFYPIEDIKQLTRDEKHTNVVFCVIKSPSLVYEVIAFRCPTEYEARQFAEHFKRIKDQSGTGYNIDLKDPPDGQEMNWSMKTTELRHMSDVNAMSQVNGNAYESMTVAETNGGISTHVDKTTKTLHITSSGIQEPPVSSTIIHDEEPFYATVDMSQKRAAREAAEASARQTTTTTVTKEAVVLPHQHTEQQTTTTVVKSSVGEQVVLDLHIPTQQKKVEVTKETIVVPAQPVQQETRFVKETNIIVPAQTQQQTTVVKEAHVVVPAQTQQHTPVVKETHVVVPAQTQQTTVVKEMHTIPSQMSHRVVKQTQPAPPPPVHQTTKKVVKESYVAPTQQTTKVIKEVHTTPKQHQTQVVREVHTAPRNTRVVREVEYNEIAVMNARIISLEQENKYLRELLKQHSVNDKDLEAFMRKETVTNGPLVDSVVIVGDSNHHAQQTVSYSRQGEAAITVGDYRSPMTRTDSDRSISSFVKVRRHRGMVGKHVLDEYSGGSLRSQQSGSLYASSVRGGNIYVEGQNIYTHAKGMHGVQHHTALNMHHHSHRGDIITQTMASPNSGYLLVPQGTFKKSNRHGHTYIQRPIDKVYTHPVPVPVDDMDGSISVSDDDDDHVFEVDSPIPVKIV
jgi:hypothetical protein